jgi:hypothetical protein
MTHENIDKEIKKRVQAVEQDIPGELEDSIMKELGQIAMTPGPLPTHMRHTQLMEKKTLLYVGTLAAAASVLLAALLLVTVFPSLLHRERIAAATPGFVEEDGIFVDARVEGMPADIFIIDQKDPDMIIVWIEKAPIRAKKN